MRASVHEYERGGGGDAREDETLTTWRAAGHKAVWSGTRVPTDLVLLILPHDYALGSTDLRPITRTSECSRKLTLLLI